jgi:hypothetical protein
VHRYPFVRNLWDAVHVLSGDDRPGVSQSTSLEDLDLVGEAMNLDEAFARGIGHAVEIAADVHHALVRDALCNDNFDGQSATISLAGYWR